MGLRIRKLGRGEYVKMNPGRAFRTSVLTVKTSPEAIEERTFYVVPGLRTPIATELRLVNFVPCYSLAGKRFFLWPVKAGDNDWSRSLQSLLCRSPEFFNDNAIRIRADMAYGRYRVWHKADQTPVVWPAQPTDELVTDALGVDAIIDRPDHPVYVDLTSGVELK